MKNTIISIGLILIMIVSLLGLLTVITKTTRENELEANVNTAAYQTMEEFFIKEKGSSSPEQKNAFVSDFMANLTQLTNSDSVLDVEVLNLDFDSGVFRVKVTEKYKNIFKLEKSLTCDKTLIADNTMQDALSSDQKKTEYLITFCWENTKISQRRAYKDECVSTPSETLINNKTIPEGYTRFVGWTKTKNSNELVDFTTEKVTSDVVYYAVFE